MQSAVYFLFIYLLTDGMANLLDNLYRNYLMDSTRSMIGQHAASKAEYALHNQHLLRRITPGLLVPLCPQALEAMAVSGKNRTIA
jgi:hypothetical protein